MFNQVKLSLSIGANDCDMSDLLSVCSDTSYISDFDDEFHSLKIDISNGPPIDIENFNIVHYNINSVLAPGRIEELTDVCRILKIDVLILSESKVDQTIPTNLLTIPGYHEPLRHDREINGRHGGGVLMYIGEALAFQHKTELQSMMYEHVWADVRINDKIYAINALYRPPNESANDHQLFLQTADTILQHLSNYDKAAYKIISGDFNFGNCFCKVPILNPKPLDSTAPDLFSSYGFQQLIDIPTRVTENSMSLISLIFVNKPDDVVCHGTLHRIADHDGVLVSLNTKIAKQKPVTKTIYDYKNADVSGLIKFIKEYDFENAVFSSPLLDQADKFTNVLKQAFAQFVPTKTVTIRPADAPWCNSYTRLLLRKKNRNYLIYKKYETDYKKLLNSNNPKPEIVTRFVNRKNKAFEQSRQSANESCKANRRVKINYGSTVNSLLVNPSISAKKKFGILLKLMKNNKFCNTPPLVENENVINDPLEKSNLFNTFFASKSTVPNSNDPAPNLERKEGVPSLSNLNTSPFELAKFIRNLKKSHLSHCGIPGKFISLISTPISFSMSRLFNNLFEIGHFPDLWKLAHITAIYKRSGPKTCKTSFRPISILPTLSKIYESVIHERLLKHCLENNIITEKQAAYLKGDSTVSQLLYIVHNIRKNWSGKKITQGLFLDVSAAFDKVWHSGLLAKLNQIGVEGTFLDTIGSYLAGRKQVVVVDGIKSEVLEVKAGVPQGSRLGPLLFIIYMNDIEEGIESDILIFADDTSLMASGTDPAETVAQLNRDLVKISIWAKKWKVLFNAKKSKDIIFSNKCLNNSPPLIFNDTFIERVNTHKHLGLYLTSSLDWNVQIKEVCLKANRKLSVLRSVKILSRQTLDLLYKLTVRSVIDYALPVYYKTLKQTELARLENLQYRAAKIVTGTLHFTSKDKLNAELGWESISERGNFLSLNIFHKIHLHETRPLIRNCMPKLDFECQVATRSKGGYLPFKHKGDKFKNSFFPNTSKLWNNLSRNIQCKDLVEFKTCVKKEIKPPKYKHFSRGSKIGNSLLTRIRVGRSFLNQHGFTIGLNDSPECLCHFKSESSEHYFLDCFLYTPERQILFLLIEHYVPNFKRLNKKQQLNLILRGLNIDDEEFLHVNTILTKAVQNFIITTKRFTTKEPTE